MCFLRLLAAGWFGGLVFLTGLTGWVGFKKKKVTQLITKGWVKDEILFTTETRRDTEVGGEDG